MFGQIRSPLRKPFQMDEKVKLLVDSFGNDKVKLNELVSEHTALHLGGPAKLFFVATHVQEIIRMVELAKSLRIPVIVFGTGSKMIISDKGFDGVIVKNRTAGMVVVGVKGKVSKEGIGVSEAMIEVESGVSISRLIEFLKKQGLNTDLLNEIKGSLGGNLFLTKALLDQTQKVKIIDETGEITEIKKEDLSLQKHIILSAVLKFRV